MEGICGIIKSMKKELTLKGIFVALMLALCVSVPAQTAHRSFRNGLPAGTAEAKAGATSGAHVQKNAKATVSAPVPQKDDGQCWAVTQNGTRCKHKKDGSKDYCKMHAATTKVKGELPRCRAMTYEGTQCSRKPDAGFLYCSQHRK